MRAQDVSRLVDLCRQAIAFASPADLAACLRAVAADGDARVLRVKNRLARDHRAGSSAGYRDVAVNLQAPPAQPPGPAHALRAVEVSQPARHDFFASKAPASDSQHPEHRGVGAPPSPGVAAPPALRAHPPGPVMMAARHPLRGPPSPHMMRVSVQPPPARPGGV